MAELENKNPRIVTAAAAQFACSPDNIDQNLIKAEDVVRGLAGEGANIILLQELFAGRYFPIDQIDCTDLAIDQSENNYLNRFQALAKELNVVLPISFFERCNNAYYNSLVMIDATGEKLGTYRKSHIPDGPGYQEKFYFTPGDTGFQVFQTAYARIGVGICWDQWFPECARCLVLRGAEILVYPTAIGSEPHDPSIQSRQHWERCIQGHAAANMVPIVVSNRVGKEQNKMKNQEITFYGSSFICDHLGDILAQAGEKKSGETVKSELDLDFIRRQRVLWGLFRDRRPELYGAITTHDGETQVKQMIK